MPFHLKFDIKDFTKDKVRQSDGSYAAKKLTDEEKTAAQKANIQPQGILSALQLETVAEEQRINASVPKPRKSVTEKLTGSNASAVAASEKIAQLQAARIKDLQHRRQGLTQPLTPQTIAITTDLADTHQNLVNQLLVTAVNGGCLFIDVPASVTQVLSKPWLMEVAVVQEGKKPTTELFSIAQSAGTVKLENVLALLLQHNMEDILARMPDVETKEKQLMQLVRDVAASTGNAVIVGKLEAAFAKRHEEAESQVREMKQAAHEAASVLAAAREYEAAAIAAFAGSTLFPDIAETAASGGPNPFDQFEPPRQYTFETDKSDKFVHFYNVDGAMSLVISTGTNDEATHSPYFTIVGVDYVDADYNDASGNPLQNGLITYLDGDEEVQVNIELHPETFEDATITAEEAQAYRDAFERIVQSMKAKHTPSAW